MTGICTGGMSVIIWGSISGGIFDIYELVPDLLLSLCGMLIVGGIRYPWET